MRLPTSPCFNGDISNIGPYFGRQGAKRDLIQKFLSPYLCGYRKGFNSQYALLAMIEKWKECLDKNGFAGAILMDLSICLIR